MTVRLLAFTDRGWTLAQKLAEGLGGEAARCGAPLSLSAWTEDAFARAQGLVYVGAAGIAVRAIAPHVRSKGTDPAVVVVDEAGRYAVALLSGHLGGANALAREISSLCGAEAVITTATDVRDAFAVDLWAKRQGCAVRELGRIRDVSGKLLSGGTVRLYSPWLVSGETPPGVELAEDEESCDFRLTVESREGTGLGLVPRIAVLGVGCRRGTEAGAIEEALRTFLSASGLDPLAVRKVCTIDLKKDEAGLLSFCRDHGWPLETFTARELQDAAGDFASSPFVQSVTGVDNVCERAAVLGSGGTLYWKKQAGGGVTMAAALAPFAPDWRWRDE